MNTVCASPPSLNLHTWADIDAAQVPLQNVSSQGIKTSAIMYSTALCLPALSNHPSQNLRLRCYWMSPKGQSANKRLDSLHLKSGWQKVIGKVVRQNCGMIWIAQGHKPLILCIRKVFILDSIHLQFAVISQKRKRSLCLQQTKLVFRSNLVHYHHLVTNWLFPSSIFLQEQKNPMTIRNVGCAQWRNSLEMPSNSAVASRF